MRTLCSLFFAACALSAQTRTVSLSWVASTTPSSTYNLYRAPASCVPQPTNFNKRNASAIAGLTYDDLGVSPGTYCYAVTAVAGGNESAYSNLFQVIIPAPPTGLTAVLPAIASVRPGGSVQFVADAPATWSINPRTGIIGQQSGLYVAPDKIQGNNVAVDVAATDGTSTVHAALTIKKGNVFVQLMRRIL